jgi:hypothetical protein
MEGRRGLNRLSGGVSTVDDEFEKGRREVSRLSADPANGWCMDSLSTVQKWGYCGSEGALQKLHAPNVCDRVCTGIKDQEQRADNNSTCLYSLGGGASHPSLHIQPLILSQSYLDGYVSSKTIRVDCVIKRFVWGLNITALPLLHFALGLPSSYVSMCVSFSLFLHPVSLLTRYLPHEIV